MMPDNPITLFAFQIPAITMPTINVIHRILEQCNNGDNTNRIWRHQNGTDLQLATAG